MLRQIVLLSLVASGLYADGGKVLFQRKAGAFNITLFAAASPVRAGRTDFSVMVQSTKDQTPVLDANVLLHLVRRDVGLIAEISAPARHAKATNKLLYAAGMDLNTTGKYRVEISVETKKESALVTGDLEVLPPEPPILAHWPYFIALPVVVLLFALNQWLKVRRRARNPQ